MDSFEPYPVSKLTTDKQCIPPALNAISTMPTILKKANQTSAYPVDTLVSPTELLNLDSWQLIRFKLGKMTRRDFDTGFRRVMETIVEFFSLLKQK